MQAFCTKRDQIGSFGRFGGIFGEAGARRLPKARFPLERLGLPLWTARAVGIETEVRLLDINLPRRHSLYWGSRIMRASPAMLTISAASQSTN